MKRSLTIIIILMGIIGLVGCGSTPPTSSNTPGGSPVVQSSAPASGTTPTLPPPAPAGTTPTAPPHPTPTPAPTTPPPPAPKLNFVQHATASNITGDYTVIDNALTNGNPNAIVMVTQNWNPSGSGGGYNNHAVGAWYTGSKWAIFNENQSAMTPGIAFNVQIAQSSASAFVQHATASNITGDYTVINSALTNGNPNAIVLVTQNWNPAGGGGGYNNHAMGVWYTGSQWAIFNEDQSTMTTGIAFNVEIVQPGASAFVQHATASNIGNDYTVINNALANGNPNAIVLVTQNWNPSGSGGMYNNHNEGVWYTNTKWAIFNQDIAAIPAGLSFNVVILSAS